jgi:hypothetical protein
MEIFDFPYHRVSTKYPANSTQVGFGGSYIWSAEPDAPPQRSFTLKIGGFKYYTAGDGSLDVTTNAAINNLGTLEAFYQEHQLWKTFIYPHPTYGNLNCKFNQPLEIPDGTPGGDGVVPEFDLTMIEQP